VSFTLLGRDRHIYLDIFVLDIVYQHKIYYLAQAYVHIVLAITIESTAARAHSYIDYHPSLEFQSLTLMGLCIVIIF